MMVVMIVMMMMIVMAMVGAAAVVAVVAELISSDLKSIRARNSGQFLTGKPTGKLLFDHTTWPEAVIPTGFCKR